MPIRREHRFFYPIDWPQLSVVIRFERAKGRCEVCARPHGQRVFHLGDGRWWDREEGSWRDGAGRFICLAIGADDVLGKSELHMWFWRPGTAIMTPPTMPRRTSRPSASAAT